MAQLIYGGGLRLRECVKLRVKDVDFERGVLVIKFGKGGKEAGWPGLLSVYTVRPCFSRSFPDNCLTRANPFSTVFSLSGLTRQQVAGEIRLCERSC